EEELEGLDLQDIGPLIEHNDLFPNRTNVSFFTPLAPTRIRARIFERGVGETSASGTGAAGAAVAYVEQDGHSPVTVVLDGGELEPETEVMPAIGAKECIFNLNLAFLDPGDVALAADPGYPVYTGGPLLAGAEPVLMPLIPALDFTPDLDTIDPDALDRARL